MLPAAFLLNHPGTQLPWWVMPHVLAVAAGEIGDPVTVFVLMKTKDGLWFPGIHIFLSALFPQHTGFDRDGTRPMGRGIMDRRAFIACE